METILDYLLSHQESVDFMLYDNEDNAAKVACAMANTSGGVIVVGMDDTGKVAGITEEDVHKVTNAIKELTNPAVPFLYSIENRDGCQVLIISVLQGSCKPYSAKGFFYIQKGDAILRANNEDVDSLFLNRRHVDRGWERMLVAGVSMSSLSDSALSRLRLALTEKNQNMSTATNEEILRNFAFLSGTYITNAGVVVTANKPSEILSQTRIRVSLFASEEKTDLINVSLFDMNLIDAVEKITEYIYSLYPVQSKIMDTRRVEFEPLPKVALREGILNSVVHRSYEGYDTAVTINIYSDRLEIANSGSLPEGIDASKMGHSHFSYLRNPDIAYAFFAMKYIEMAGSGTARILDVCRRNGCETPFWTCENNQVVLTFPGVFHHQSSSQKKDWQVISERLTQDKSVAESLSRILDYMETNGQVKLAELASLTGKSYPTVKRYMQMLKDAALIRYEGSARTGGWVIS